MTKSPNDRFNPFDIDKINLYSGMNEKEKQYLNKMKTEMGKGGVIENQIIGQMIKDGFLDEMADFVNDPKTFGAKQEEIKLVNNIIKKVEKKMDWNLSKQDKKGFKKKIKIFISKYIESIGEEGRQEDLE